MPSEQNVTSAPVQFIRLNNIAWMNCKLKIMYGWDTSKNTYTKETAWCPEVMKDQDSQVDLSSIEGLAVGDTVRPYVDAVQAQLGEAVKYAKNRQTATFQFSGTLFKSWLGRQ
jgi:hypothetical protein